MEYRIAAVYSAHVDRTPRIHREHTRRRAITLVLGGLLALVSVLAESPKKELKPTERLIRQYQKLVAEGALLNPAGWKMASKLFVRSDPYPANGEIQVVSTGGLIGEDWANADRAQVETKWNDAFGTIDSALRFKAAYEGGSIGMIETFNLVHPWSGLENDLKSGASPATGWRIEETLKTRSATIPAAIKYVERMRDHSTDPIIRRNAERTIRVLQHTTVNCAC
ncbi:MAG TPA: hypothetical protein VE377_03935 [Candidatus Dormibacteraeota bacterium]|nr:hypothetical protein [Candidatus Dormibacteraeota bacterium]